MQGDDTARKPVRRLALLVEYDGTAYCGSQYQDNGPSIQAELESAITKLTGENRRIAFAGRTDAGVHALGQVASLETESALGRYELRRGLNHFLPEDIAIRQLVDVDRSFDPRRDAQGRRYRYCIENSRVRSPLTRKSAWHVAKPLDIAAMQHAARQLVGRHDFAAFAAPYDGTTARTLRRCEVRARSTSVSVEMEAEAFLPHQVRRTVGPLVDVGLGRTSSEEIARWLEDANPSSAGPAAPPCGLYLVSIAYDGLELWGCDGDGRDA